MPPEVRSVADGQHGPSITSSLELATFTYEDRRVILPAIDQAIAMCGCWLLQRKALSFTQTEFRFELQLRSILELYAALIAAGLELTQASHLDLTSLCTLRKHQSRPAGFPGLVHVRLEVSFLEDLTEPAGPSSVGGQA